MLKAVFIDFYGTLVHEDGDVIREISREIFNTGNVNDISDIGRFWWNEFHRLFMNAYGDNFKRQRDIEYMSLVGTAQHFGSSADPGVLCGMMFEHWRRSPVFSDSLEFLEGCPVPVYIVSNIDREDITEAVGFNGIKAAGIFTSEDARSYKPRRELFEYALRSVGVEPRQVIHIGDSLESDVIGARGVGISPVWVNRGGRAVPDDVVSVDGLTGALKLILDKM